MTASCNPTGDKFCHPFVVLNHAQFHLKEGWGKKLFLINLMRKMEKILPMIAEKERTVIVFSRTPLFGEGLLKLLSPQENIKILGIAQTIPEVKDLASQALPDVIIMNQSDSHDLTKQALSELLDISSGQVLSFTLDDRDMVIYTRKSVPASIQALLNALKNDEN